MNELSRQIIMYTKEGENGVAKIELPDGTVIEAREGNIDLSPCQKFVGSEIVNKKIMKSGEVVITPDAAKGKLLSVTIDEEHSKGDNKVYVLNIGAANTVLFSPKEFEDESKYVIPNRELLEAGDICILIRRDVNQPFTYVRIEHTEKSTLIGYTKLGIVFINPMATYMIVELPNECIKIKNTKGFKVKTMPFPASLCYFPLKKKQTIITPNKINDNIFRQGN